MKRLMWISSLVACWILLETPSTQAQIRLVGELDPSATTSYGDIWGSNDYAFLGSRLGEGVFIIDIADPAAPFVASNYLPSGGAAPQDVKVQGDVGYFAMNSQGGVDLVDLSDPTQPTFLSNLAIGGVHNVFISGDHLFTASGSSPFVKAFDVSNPAEPLFLYDIPTGSRTHDMTVLGDRMYVSNFGGGTQIFDLSSMSTETQPELLGSFLSGPNTHSNWVTDNGQTLVSAAEINNGTISIYDIADPANAQLLSEFNSRDFLVEGIRRSHIPHNPVVVGDLLYVSWYQIGVQVFDISDPSNPVHLGRFDTQNNWGVYPFLGPETILLSDIENGLQIVDVTSALNGTVGDFNGDGEWDCADLDQLLAEIASGSGNRDFDVSGDGTLNPLIDVREWLIIAARKNLPDGAEYSPADANLDGNVDQADFDLWLDHKFAASAISSRCEGDFNADGQVDGSDFLIWKDNRTFLTQLQRGATVQAVPEPGVPILLLVWLCSWHRVRRSP